MKRKEQYVLISYILDYCTSGGVFKHLHVVDGVPCTIDTHITSKKATYPHLMLVICT